MTAARLCLALLLAGSCVTTLSAHPGSGIVVDQRGAVYFIDTAAGIWRIAPDGALTKFGGPKFHWLALDERSTFAAGHLPSVAPGDLEAVGTRPTLLASSDVPVSIGPDDSLYYPEFRAGQGLRIIRCRPSGEKSVHTTLPSLRLINGLAADGRGALYFTEDKAVKKIDQGGTVSVVASNVTVENCVSIPGIEPAIQPYLRGLAVAADGTIFVAASGCGAVLEITPQGGIRSVLRSSAPWSPTAVAVSPDGLVVLEYVHTVAEIRPAWVPRVRRVSANGRVTTLATITRR